MLDLTERIAAYEPRKERSAELDRRDREYGGLTPHDRTEEEIRRSMAGWGPYKPSANREDLDGTTARIFRETVGSLYADCGRAVRRWAGWAKRDTAATLRADMLLLLLDWPSHGREPHVLDLGGSNGYPLRRHWRQTVTRADGRSESLLTAAAWRALKAALKQAREHPDNREQRICEVCEQRPAEGWTDATDASPRLHRCTACARSTSGGWHAYRTDPQPVVRAAGDILDIAALSEEQQREADAPTRLPDIASAEVIACTLDIPLDAGRAIVARYYPAATVRDHAESWGISVQSARNALHRGEAHVQRLYPDPVDLVTELESVARVYRKETYLSAILSLLALSGGHGSEAAARAAVGDWRATHGDLPWQTAAHMAACRNACRRAGADLATAVDVSESLIPHCTRLLTAEEHRGERMAARGARGSGLPGMTLSMAAADRSAAPVTSEPLFERVWTYGLTARDDRAARDTAAAVPAAPRQTAGELRTTREKEQEQRAAARSVRTARPPRPRPRTDCRDCLLGKPHATHPAR